jgi:hypothetical protein
MGRQRGARHRANPRPGDAWLDGAVPRRRHQYEIQCICA